VNSDNYSYLLIDEKLNIAAAVDPAQPEKVLFAAKEQGVQITTVLTTHHHWDHADGNPGMIQEIPNLRVYGGSSKVKAITDIVKSGDIIKLGHSLIHVHSVPCHTLDHLFYEVEDTEDSHQPHSLFTGDTLFISGCGRFFEGTADQMYHALYEVAAKLPHNTLVYCGHEYTVKNLQFAKTIEPKNENVLAKLEWAENQRSQNRSTVPSTIAEELTYNPFMRCNLRSVAEAVGMIDSDTIKVLQEVRNRKDKF